MDQQELQTSSSEKSPNADGVAAQVKSDPREEHEYETGNEIFQDVREAKLSFEMGFRF